MADIIEFDPEDIPNTPVEELLDSLTLGVMRDSISQQIKGNISSQQNFLSIVIEKFEIIDKNLEDPDVKREISFEIIDFCRALVFEIIELYGLYYDDDQGESKRVIEVLSVLYNFFILRGEEFVGNFLINYITNNRAQLMEDADIYSDGDQTESVTTKSNEKKKVPKDSVWLLSHIDSIIDYVASLQIDPLEFLRTVSDGDFYVETLIGYFEEGLIGGDFSNQYMTRFIDDYSSEKSTEIRNTVRLAFI